MITSIVGRLIKKPERIDRVQIPGKRIVLFTLVQHISRGERRLSLFYNLSMLVGTDAQYELVMRFEKSTVLLFSFPRISYVKQSDKSPEEQVINLYADVENFKIVAGAEAAFAPSAGGSELSEPAEQAQTPRRPLPQASRLGGRPTPQPGGDTFDLSELEDPFQESEPASAARADDAAGAPVRKAPNPAKARRPAPPPPEDLSDLSDPFSGGEP